MACFIKHLAFSFQLQKASGGFYVVGFFDHNGIAEGDIDHENIGKIRELRLLVGKSHENWAILSEIHLRTPELDSAKS